MLVNSVAFVYQAVRRQGGGACAEKAGGSGPEKTEQWQVFRYFLLGPERKRTALFHAHLASSFQSSRRCARWCARRFGVQQRAFLIPTVMPRLQRVFKSSRTVTVVNLCFHGPFAEDKTEFSEGVGHNLILKYSVTPE